MGGTKVTQGFTDSWGVHVEGLWLVLTYRGKEVERKNLKMFRLAHRDLEVYIGENEGKEKSEEVVEGAGEQAITEGEVLKFVQVYQGLQKKYTGRQGTYVPPARGQKPTTQRNWSALEKAAIQAKQMNMEPLEYLTLLINYYSRRGTRDGAQMNFPYPTQLQGEWAEGVIVNESARSNAKAVAPGIKAERLAHTNRFLGLDKDQAFIEARSRCKVGKQTAFDIEYLKARTTQVYGEPPDWIEKYAKAMKERDKAEADEQK